MSQELVTYIVLGSHQKLKKLKKFKIDSEEECIFLNFKDESSIILDIDSVIADSNGSLIVLLPPSSTPKKINRETLKKMAMINYPVWGWFDISNREDPLSSSLKKINSILRTTPVSYTHLTLPTKA